MQQNGSKFTFCSGWKVVGTLVVTHPPASAPSLTVPAGADADGSYSASCRAAATATEYVVEETHPTDGVMTFYDGPDTTAAQVVYASGEVKFRVKACNASGCSAWSGYVHVILQSGGGPGGPGGPQAVQDADQTPAATPAQPAGEDQQP